MTLALHGLGVSRGIAIGRAVRMDDALDDVEQRTVDLAEREDEAQRYLRAAADVRAEFAQVRRHIPSDAPPELSALMQVHEMILTDPALATRPIAMIRERGMNAEWALAETADHLAAQFDAMDDPYLRERKQDVMQVVTRVRKALAGRTALRKPAAAPGEARVLVAPDLAPADMLHLRHDDDGGARIAAFCTEYGGRTSHTAILARSMNVPAVVGVNGARRITDDDVVIVDGDAGVLLVAPDAAVLAHYRERLITQDEERTVLARLKSKRATTRDGRTVSLFANIELPEDAPIALDANADGVGLFRSEFLFMNRTALPGEDEQFEAYRAAIVAMQGRPVTIRTLDVGADKTLQHDEGRHAHVAENPALGLRAIRYSLSEPAMFATQLRALLRASAYGPLRILVPMLASAAEIDATLAHLARARAELLERGVPVAPQIPIGGMIEVPAAALTIGAFTSRLDFLSIGTNDLIQYTLAIDRADSAVAELYDPLHPAVLGLIAHTIRAGTQAGLDVSVCGEMAGDAQIAPLLLGMGLTQFSMHPAQLPYVKRAILESDAHACEALAAQALAQVDAREIRRLLALQQRVRVAV